MNDNILKPSDLILSIVFTWGIGLSIPLVVRYAIFKKPLKQGWAIIIAGSNWLMMWILSDLMGSKSRTHGALILVAVASYFILRKSMTTDKSAIINEEQRSPSQDRIEDYIAQSPDTPISDIPDIKRRGIPKWVIWVAVSLPVISFFGTIITHNIFNAKSAPEQGTVRSGLDPKTEKEMLAIVDKTVAEQRLEEGKRFLESKQYDAALNALNKSIELNPKDVEAYVRRGSAYGYLGNDSQAIKDYDRAIELNPKDPVAYVNRGKAYGYLGNRSQAIKDLKIAARLGDKSAQEALSKRKIRW